MSEISCDEVLAEIEDYLHGELDPNRMAVFAAHLGSCSPCLDRAEFQRKLKDIVRTKCRSDTPAHLVLRIRQSIRREWSQPPGDGPVDRPIV